MNLPLYPSEIDLSTSPTQVARATPMVAFQLHALEDVLNNRPFSGGSRRPLSGGPNKASPGNKRINQPRAAN